MRKERLRQRIKEGWGIWPSHLCSVSCHYVLWGSAKAVTSRFHSSSSYTGDFKTHTSPWVQRGGAASRVWQGRSPSFQTEQSSVPVRGAQPLPQMLQSRCCCPSRDCLIVYSSTQLQPQAFRGDWEVFVGKKNTTWPTCFLKGKGRGRERGGGERGVVEGRLYLLS